MTTRLADRGNFSVRLPAGTHAYPVIRETEDLPVIDGNVVYIFRIGAGPPPDAVKAITGPEKFTLGAYGSGDGDHLGIVFRFYGPPEWSMVREASVLTLITNQGGTLKFKGDDGVLDVVFKPVA